jgi:hypothetical protein
MKSPGRHTVPPEDFDDRHARIFRPREGCQRAGVRETYERFAEHLRDIGQLSGWRFLRRHPHDCYNADPPFETYLVAMEFDDLAQANAAYARVAENTEPCDALHRAVFSKIRSRRFVLYADV